jgi:hypothetical protein
MNFKYLREHPEIIRENLDLIYDQTTWQLFREAKEWYPAAHTYAKDFAEEFHKSITCTSGLISVLSVQKSWISNLLLTREFLESKGETCRHLGGQVDKARRIYRLHNDTPERVAEIVRGLKTVNFMYNLISPEDERWVCLDVHMCQLLTGNYDYKVATNTQYHFLKEQLIQFAKDNNLIPSTMQALVWLIFKKIKPRGRLEKTNILYNLV